MASTKSRDYPTLLKRSFLLGVGLFLAGALGTAVLPSLVGPLPGWERALLFDMEVVGILVGLLSPFVFGVFLPLTE